MSNLPPGVTESMIPGNRPEDQAFDRILDSEIGVALEDLADLVVYSRFNVSDVEKEVAVAIGQIVNRLTQQIEDDV